MWQEKLQDAVTSHPWLEPHQDIKRKSQAPGMQLDDWYGFTVPKDGAIYSMLLTATWNMPTSSFSIAKPVTAMAWTRVNVQRKT